MAQNILSKKIKFNNAKNFKESFYDSLNPNVGYVFIGNHIPYANSDVDILDVVDTSNQQKFCWDNMIAAKKITGNDLEFVVFKNDWQSGKIYNQFDDTISFDDLLDINTTNSMYVIANNYIYKCLSNNFSQPSTSQPYGEGSGGIIITSDSYIWKYMYKISEYNTFSTDTWIPIPSYINKLEYFSNTSYSVPGEITTVVVYDGGSGYYNNNINVNSFLSSCTVLTYTNIQDVPNTIAINMGLNGTGIEIGTYITNIDSFNRKIGLSQPTNASGGGSGNLIFVYTKSEIIGDGTGCVSNTFVSNGIVDKIELNNFGKNYNYSNVIIYGTGTNARARCIISPRFGHSFNPAEELGAHNVMINMDFNSDESDIISTDIKYRQYGFFVNPYKYNETSITNYSNAELVISQTTNILLLDIGSFMENDFVYQGNADNPSFSGVICNITANNIVKLTNVKGTPIIGNVLKGFTEETSSGKTVFDVTYPEFIPYSGDVLYIKNVLPIQRTVDQIENIKFVIKF
jgi:hypothetical protein